MVDRAVEMMARIVPGLADRLLSTLLRTSRASWRTAALVRCVLCRQRLRVSACRTRSLPGRRATKACGAFRMLAATT